MQMAILVIHMYDIGWVTGMTSDFTINKGAQQVSFLQSNTQGIDSITPSKDSTYIYWE